MDWLSALLFGILGSIVATAIWEKAKQGKTDFYMDEKSISLLNLALKILPDSEREIYQEEWFMFLCDQTSAQKRLLHAMLFAQAAIKISAEVRLVVPLAAALSKNNISTQQSKLKKVLLDQNFVGSLELLWWRIKNMIKNLLNSMDLEDVFIALDHLASKSTLARNVLKIIGTFVVPLFYGYFLLKFALIYFTNPIGHLMEWLVKIFGG